MLSKGFRVELKARALSYNLTQLAEEVGLSRQALYDFFEGGDMKLSNLEKLMKALGVEFSFTVTQPQEKDVLGNLEKYGSPMVVGAPNVPMDLEAALAGALELVGKEGRLTSVLPYMLVHKARTLDSKKLLSLLRDKPNSLQLLGYFLDVALAYRKRKSLVDLKANLQSKLELSSDLILREKDQAKALKDFKRFDNPAAKKWRVGTRDNLSDLVARCRKWEELEHAA